MPLINIIGDVRTGKTLFMTAQAVDEVRENPETTEVFHNYDFNMKGAVKIEPEDLFKIKKNGKQHLVLIDEAYAWLESRCSAGNEMNQFLSYILFQSGKDDTTFLLTEQLLSTIDKRFRKMGNLIIECERDPAGFIYTFMTPDLSEYNSYYLTEEDMQEYYQYYGTFTKVQPIDEDMRFRVVTDKTKLGPIIDEIIQKLNEKHPGRWTKGAIDAWLMNNRYAPSFGTYVYNEMKLRELSKKDKD